MLPERIKQLDVHIGDMADGQLLKHSVFEFRYLSAAGGDGPAVGLLMPRTAPTYTDGDLFPCMDQNLPEGDLYMRLRQMFPKQPLTPMHLLALMGRNGIGRLGFHLSQDRGGGMAPPPSPTLSKAALLATPYSPKVFDELVAAYLATGCGIAGMQPKIMVPDRPSIPIPTLIVKAASDAYPGLAANEFLCLSVARAAGLEVPSFALSDDGQMLLIDRFDIQADGARQGFEDMAALMGKRVRDTLADRKYQGSYQAMAEVLRLLRAPAQSFHRLFEQVALTVMLRNGDGHLKNFGVLYSHAGDVRLSPVFDVVTTAIYTYTRYSGGPELEDNTLALKLFRGRHESRGYPTPERLLAFGREVCGVSQPLAVLQRIAQGMSEVLQQARSDERVPAPLLAAMAEMWRRGLGYVGAR